MIPRPWTAARLSVAAVVCALLPSAAWASLPSVSDVARIGDELRSAPLLAADIEREQPESCAGPFCAERVQAKTRVRGFELGLHCRIGGEGGLTCAPRRAYGFEYGERTVEQSVFTGHYFDTETSLYYAKARYVDPQFGRFLSQDDYMGEMSEPPSLHRYAYSWNRPTFFVDPTGRAVIESEEIYTNEILQRTREYDPESGSVSHHRPCGAGNECVFQQQPDIPLKAVLAQAGGDKEKAYQILLNMKAAGQRSAAGIQIEESDFTAGGQLNTVGLFNQFIGTVGTHAGSIDGLREEFFAAVAGAKAGEVRDISFLYNLGHDYSNAIANKLAQEYAEKTFGPDFIQREAFVAGQWGAAPPDVSADAALSLAGDTVTAISAGLGIYRLGVGLAGAGTEQLSTRSAASGLSSNAKGELAKGWSREAAIARGDRIFGEEVDLTFRVGGKDVTVRADLLTKPKDGGDFYVYIESKYSGAAPFTQNQRLVVPELVKAGDTGATATVGSRSGLLQPGQRIRVQFQGDIWDAKPKIRGH